MAMTLLDVWEADQDEHVLEYPGLTDGHLVAHCRCGRLVLTGLPGAKRGGSLAPVIAARGFRVTDFDDLPPAGYEWVPAGGGRRRVVCCGCYVATRRANRNHKQGRAGVTMCSKCGKVASVLINGRCCGCNPFRACRHCTVGTLVSSPTPKWMNRFKCDTCGKAVSK